MIQLMVSYFFCERLPYDYSGLSISYILSERISDFCNGVNDGVVIDGYMEVLDWGHTFPNLAQVSSLYLGPGIKVGEAFPHLNRVGKLKTYEAVDLGNINTIDTYIVGSYTNARNFKETINYDDLGDNNYIIKGQTYNNKVKILN